MDAITIAFALLFACIFIGIASILHTGLDNLMTALCMIHEQLERIADAEWVYNPCEEEREDD